MLNRKFEGATLFEIDYTPKGTKEMKTVKVWAGNRLVIPPGPGRR